MFELADAVAVGEYLADVMIKKFGSKRKFCMAYYKEREGREAAEDEVQKIANRISQITKGKKGIQTYDLPIFCRLLNMSCEQILSAGKCFSPQSDRMTNYSVAFSKDEHIWEEYVNREDKLILNPDEYGKTAIDYALEFKNYGFIKFLLDKRYIWFDGRDDNNYVMTFGAGTSIKRREPYRIDDHLQYQLATEDRLRTEVIALAVENKDRKVLDTLRAREIPELYYKAHYLSCRMPDVEAHKDRKMILQIASASDEIVDYFTDTFAVRDIVKYKDGSRRKHTFMFPYISDLLDLLVENKHGSAEHAIRKCIEHNKKTYEILKRLIEESIKRQLSDVLYDNEDYRKQIKHAMFKFFEYSENGDMVYFRDLSEPVGIITNIVHMTKSSSDDGLNHLIDELNNYFKRIVEIKSEYINETEE